MLLDVDSPLPMKQVIQDTSNEIRLIPCQKKASTR